MISLLCSIKQQRKSCSLIRDAQSTLLVAFNERRRTAKAAKAAQGVVGLSFEEMRDLCGSGKFQALFRFGNPKQKLKKFALLFYAFITKRMRAFNKEKEEDL